LDDEKSRIESEPEVQSFLQSMTHALNNGAQLIIQYRRRIDRDREIKFTNTYTVAKLFPDENPVEALKRELRQLQTENYIRTVKDSRFPKRSEMREFGKVYNDEGVYIKIRAELLTNDGQHSVFVMSFHFAERPFTEESFPYKRK